MLDFLKDLFSTNFVSHGFCMRWQSDVIWLHVVSDALIVLAYASIPFLLLRVARKRRDMPFSWMFLAFGGFILACGATHAMSIVTLWKPLYRLEGLSKALTALASITTALCLWRLLPTLVRIPSQADLVNKNQLLNAEIGARMAIEKSLQAARDQLEGQVQEQTRELFAVNATLQKAVAEEQHTANRLREREDQVQKAFNAARVGLWTWEIASGRVVSDPQITKLYGLASSADITQVQHFYENVHPDDRERVTLALENALAGVSDFDLEFRILHPDQSERWIGARAALTLGADGKPFEMIGINMDLTAAKQAEAALRESELQFTTLAETIPQLAWMTAPDGSVLWFNRRWYEYTVTSPEQAMGSGWSTVLHPGDLHRTIDVWTNATRTGTLYEIEYRLRRGNDGTYRWHLGRALPFKNESGVIVKWFGTCTDIHDQKTAKDCLEAIVQTRTEDLRRMLGEKETLLREIHHRVKNNLQIISSLLRMQARSLQDSSAAAALNESQQRVLSMALIHEQLYGRPQMDQIDFGEYVYTLVNELFRSYADKTGNVVSRVRTSRVLLNIDQAIPCGLILNEVVTNALKYAYPHPRSGEISVELTQDKMGLQLRVSDNGTGMGKDFDWANAKSLGLPMANILARQIGGVLSIQPQPGVTITLRVPIVNRT